MSILPAELPTSFAPQMAAPELMFVQIPALWPSGTPAKGTFAVFDSRAPQFR